MFIIAVKFYLWEGSIIQCLIRFFYIKLSKNVVGEIVLLWILMKYNFLLPNYEKGYKNDAFSFIKKFRSTWSCMVNDSLFRQTDI